MQFVSREQGFKHRCALFDELLAQVLLTVSDLHTEAYLGPNVLLEWRVLDRSTQVQY